nr:MAG: phosphoglycolate phosphatase [Candidatus Kentron sp. TUN]
MVQRAFGIDPGNSSFARLLERFLEIYHDSVATHTRLFSGMDEVLMQIEARAMCWGIVTNKSNRFTKPLTAALGLIHRAACIVSGDTTVHRKPYPDPLLFACRQIKTVPAHCLYIGDATKDVEAGLRAGIRTAVALFGYISSDESPETWGANCLFSSPQDILDWLVNSP